MLRHKIDYSRSADYEHCDCCGSKANVMADYRSQDGMLISKFWSCTDCMGLSDRQFFAKYHLTQVGLTNTGG